MKIDEKFIYKDKISFILSLIVGLRKWELTFEKPTGSLWLSIQHKTHELIKNKLESITEALFFIFEKTIKLEVATLPKPKEKEKFFKAILQDLKRKENEE